MINKILLFVFTLVLLNGCQSIKDTLTLKKQQNVDEFLIEKKNPLVVPPEFSKLPKPRKKIEEENTKKNDKIDLSKILEKNTGMSKSNSSNELEKSISNILNKK